MLDDYSEWESFTSDPQNQRGSFEGGGGFHRGTRPVWSAVKGPCWPGERVRVGIGSKGEDGVEGEDG